MIKSEDCDESFWWCKCEYCDECKQNYCICEYNIQKSEDLVEIIANLIKKYANIKQFQFCLDYIKNRNDWCNTEYINSYKKLLKLLQSKKNPYVKKTKKSKAF